jgi:hypothetical protein
MVHPSLKLTIITLFTLIALLGFVYARVFSNTINPIDSIDLIEPQRASQTRRRTPTKQANRGRAAKNYSSFSHSTAAHQMACSSCHKFPTANWKTVRKEDQAFPDITDYPEHASCVGCHRQQFFRGASPQICSICHTNPSPRNGSRHPFPNPSESFNQSAKAKQAEASQFRVDFPHDKHIGLVGQHLPSNRRDQLVDQRGEFEIQLISASLRQDNKANSSCNVCHQTYQTQGESEEEFVTKRPKDLPEEAFWLKKGTFKTLPNGHANCFTCHSLDSGLNPIPSDCAACHKLAPSTPTLIDFDSKLASSMGITDRTTLERWRRRTSVRYRHEWFSHASLDCTSCHNVLAMKTLEEQTLKVAIRSCGGEGTGCHIEPTGDGILNIEVDKKKANLSFQCTKCHAILGKEPVPASHISAIEMIKNKK